MIDTSVQKLIDKALGGQRITADDALPLFTYDENSPEAALIRWAAFMIAEKASDHVGLIYAQIGLDCLPCAVNCQFCKYASNTYPAAEGFAVDLESILKYAQLFNNEGVHLISLMATGGLSFQKIVDIAQEVRSVIDDDMLLYVNISDFDIEQAKQLKSIGVQGAYHANRIGEGVITNASPHIRLQTMKAIKAAGLELMTAVEPVLATTPDTLILERMEELVAFIPYCSGVNTLTPIPNTPMQDAIPLNRRRTAYYSAILRLLAGDSIPFGAGGDNVRWVDAGTSARGSALLDNSIVLKNHIALQRKALMRSEKVVPSRSCSF